MLLLPYNASICCPFAAIPHYNSKYQRHRRVYIQYHGTLGMDGDEAGKVKLVICADSLAYHRNTTLSSDTTAYLDLMQHFHLLYL